MKRARENRALTGLSMGGGQAFTIGLKHLDLLAPVSVLSLPGRAPVEGSAVRTQVLAEALEFAQKLFQEAH